MPAASYANAIPCKPFLIALSRAIQPDKVPITLDLRLGMMGKGGRRGTTWQTQWNHGNTKHIRVPIALEPQIIEFARALDSGRVLLDREVLQKEILLLIDGFVEQRIAQFHPNQHSRIASATSRRWDELRRFRDAIALGAIRNAAHGLSSQSPLAAARH